MVDPRTSRAAATSPRVQATISTVLPSRKPDSRPSARENAISTEWVTSAATMVVTATASALPACRSNPSATTPAASAIARTTHGAGEGPGIQARVPVALAARPSTVSGIIQV